MLMTGRGKKRRRFPQLASFFNGRKLFCDLWELLGSKGLDEAFK